MAEALETNRLVLRPWAESDVSLLESLATNPKVVRYIGDGQLWSAARVGEVAAAVSEQWQRYRFGWRVIAPKDTDEPIGFAMLNFLGEGTAGLDPREFEIGWWLLPPSWGRGLATEGARACLGEAFGRLGARSVVARLQPDNDASAAVAARLSMAYEFDTTGRFGEPISVYRLVAPEPAAWLEAPK